MTYEETAAKWLSQFPECDIAAKDDLAKLLAAYRAPADRRVLELERELAVPYRICFRCGYEVSRADWNAILPDWNAILHHVRKEGEVHCPGCHGQYGEWRPSAEQRLTDMGSKFCDEREALTRERDEAVKLLRDVPMLRRKACREAIGMSVVEAATAGEWCDTYENRVSAFLSTLDGGK